MTTGPGGGSGTGPGGGSGTGPGRDGLLEAEDTGLDYVTEMRAVMLVSGLSALVADAEAQLSGPLHLLAAAAAELPDGDDKRSMNAAAAHLNCALVRLARVATPACRDQTSAAGAATIATPGGPVQTTRLAEGECLTPGYRAALDDAVAGSGQELAAPYAGAISGRGGRDASRGAASRPDTFSLPAPPEFQIGTARYGAFPRTP